MDIFIGKMAGAFPKSRKSLLSEEGRKKKDRRKSRKDRRKEARVGIVVTLSSIRERRSGLERRKLKGV